MLALIYFFKNYSHSHVYVMCYILQNDVIYFVVWDRCVYDFENWICKKFNSNRLVQDSNLVRRVSVLRR